MVGNCAKFFVCINSLILLSKYDAESIIIISIFQMRPMRYSNVALLK